MDVSRLVFVQIFAQVNLDTGLCIAASHEH